MNTDTLEEEHPEIYCSGATGEMCEKFDAEWGDKAIWHGEWPGVMECQEYGLYARMVPGLGWQPCDKDDPGATEDLNTLYSTGTWDVTEQKWKLPRN